MNNIISDDSATCGRDVYRIFIIGFPTSGVGRYFNRGGEATSDAQLNPGNSISVCIAHIHEGLNTQFHTQNKI